MISDVTKLGAASLCFPTRRMGNPEAVLWERFNQKQEKKIAQLYENLTAKVKNGENLTGAEKMQLALLKAFDIAEYLSHPVIKYMA